MSGIWIRRARINLKVLIITGAIVAILVGGAFFGRKIRRQVMVQRALAEGQAAYQAGDWETARVMLGRWIGAHPNDKDVLVAFAEAELSVRPLQRDNINRAASAYRRVLRIEPANEGAFGRLSRIYEGSDNFGELDYIARRRIEALPGDVGALLARAKAAAFRQEFDEARTLLNKITSGPAMRERGRPEYTEACLLLSSLAVQEVTPGGDAHWEQEARDWLDRAVEYDPDSPLPLVQRAALGRLLSNRIRRDATEAELARAKEDLETAEQLQTRDPRVPLALAQEWTNHREFDRAAAQLDIAEHFAPEAIAGRFVDPADWTVQWFILKATLCLLSEKREEGVGLAESVLGTLGDRPQRTLVLPAAVELFLAGDRVDEARASLDELLDRSKLLPTNPGREARIAYLQAVLAWADEQPHRVIDILEPLADRFGPESNAHALLAQAFARIGQPGRTITTLSKSATVARPDMARLAAVSHLAQGDWAGADDVLNNQQPAEDEDLETRVLRLASKIGLAYQRGLPAAQETLATAERELKLLRAAHPDYVVIRLLLAAIAETRGDLNLAETELKTAVAECDRPLQALLPLATLQAKQKRFTDARSTFQTACDQHGETAVPWLTFCDFLVSQRDIPSAIEKVREAQDAVILPDAYRAVTRRLAELDVLHGERAAGVELLRDLATSEPPDIDACAMLLGLPEVMADKDAAERWLTRIKEIEGDSGLTWRVQEARLWLASSRWREQRTEIEESLRFCIDAEPRWKFPVLLLGGLYERLGELDDAEFVYREAFEKAHAPEVGDRLLAVLQLQRRFAEAREVLDALSRQLDEHALGMRRIHLAMGAGDYGEAVRELEMRIAGGQPDPLDLVSLARAVYLQNNDVERALEYLRQANELAPAAPAVVAAQVFILGEQKRVDEAEAILAELIKTHPTPGAYMLRASFHAGIGRADLEEQDYRELMHVAENDLGYAALGELYARSDQLDRAVQTWEEGLEHFPDSLSLRRGLAKALLMRRQPGDWDRVELYLTQLEESFPNDLDLLWVRAVKLVGEDQPTMAQDVRVLLGRAVSAPPGRVEAHNGLVRIASQLGEYDLARELAERGLERNPGDPSLTLSEARAELALGNLKRARELALSLVDHDDQSIAPLEVLYEVAVRQGDRAALEQGVTDTTHRLADDAENEDLQLLLARLYVALDQADSAASALESFCASTAGQQSVRSMLMLHDLLRMRGDLTGARKRLQAAAAIAPDEPAILRARILLLAAEERFDDIAALSRTEGEKLAWTPETLFLAASVLSQRSPAYLDVAIAFCERAVAQAEEYVPARATLALLVYQKGDVEKAIEHYRTLLTYAPSHPEVRNNLAWILAESRGEYKEALTHARKAVALQPDNGHFRDTLGFVLQKLGQRVEARDEYVRSVELMPPGSVVRAQSLYHLAGLCHEMKDWAPLRPYRSEVRSLTADEGAPALSPPERQAMKRWVRAMDDE